VLRYACVSAHLTSRRTHLQRFSTFPAGWPGLALLFLRLVLGVSVVAFAVRTWGVVTEPFATIAAAAVAACGVLAVIGLFTPVATLVLAGAVVVWLAPIPVMRLADVAPPAAAWHVVIEAIAIAMLGPGAYSIDARLFGGREIVVSRAPRAR
jgi:hypothetical protein